MMSSVEEHMQMGTLSTVVFLNTAPYGIKKVKASAWVDDYLIQAEPSAGQHRNDTMARKFPYII